MALRVTCALADCRLSTRRPWTLMGRLGWVRMLKVEWHICIAVVRRAWACPACFQSQSARQWQTGMRSRWEGVWQARLLGASSWFRAAFALFAVLRRVLCALSWKVLVPEAAPSRSSFSISFACQRWRVHACGLDFRQRSQRLPKRAAVMRLQGPANHASCFGLQHCNGSVATGKRGLGSQELHP